jgi:hypothetical protein
MIKLLIQQDNAGHTFLAQAEGWGKSFTASCKGKTNLDKWILFAQSRIVLDKLKGFVENRRIAYNAKGYKEKSKMDAIVHLKYYFERMTGKPPLAVYSMVVAHEFKFRTLLPSVANKQSDEVEEIIKYCKDQIKHNETAY